MTGFYELSDRTMCFDTGSNQSELGISKKELIKKVRFYRGWVYLINTDRYNSFKGQKNDVAKKKEMELVPKKILSTLTSNKPYRVSGKSDSVSTNGDTSIINPYPININKGTNKDYMESTSLTDTLVAQISKQKNVSFADGKKIKDRLLLYCESSGKTYKNYKATLEMWIMRGVDEGKIKQLKINGGSIAEALRKAGRNDI